jgi:hypothetical protein
MASSTPLISGTDFITVGTTDIDRAARGVKFEGETLDSGVCYQTFFSDPDGNALAIHHRYAPGAPPSESG